MKINEIFKSIQGETTFAGYPCTFIRLTGCNLRCIYCDTKYAYYKGKEKSIREILNTVKKNKTKLVAITGGEPLLQKDVYQLMNKLTSDGYDVILETNGSLSVEKVNKKIIKILDVKTPSSSVEKRNLLENFNYLNPTDEIKFVISNKTDFNWALDIIEKHALLKKSKINLSPVYKKIKPDILARWILKSKKNLRLNLQIHKNIWANRVKMV